MFYEERDYNKFTWEDLGDIATIEKLPEMDGRFMVAVFSPKQQDKKKGSKKVKEENPKEA